MFMCCFCSGRLVCCFVVVVWLCLRVGFGCLCLIVCGGGSGLCCPACVADLSICLYCLLDLFLRVVASLGLFGSVFVCLRYLFVICGL